MKLPQLLVRPSVFAAEIPIVAIGWSRLAVLGAVVSVEEPVGSSLGAVTTCNCLGAVVFFMRGVVVEALATVSGARRWILLVE